MTQYENESMLIILHSGNARSSAFEALAFIKKGAVKSGLDSLKVAKDEMLIAQKEHAKLLQQFALSNGYANMLLVHAEDHVSSTQIAVDLIGEIIEMYERFGK